MSPATEMTEKARLVSNVLPQAPDCAFSQQCLLSHRALPGKETTGLNEKVEDDKQATDGSWSSPKKAAPGQNREIDTLHIFSSPISLC